MNFVGIKNIDELIRKAEDISVTSEMKKFFNNRTKKHIELVQKYCRKIEDIYGDRFKGLNKRGKDHDKSKFKEPELDPYIYITWEYHCKDKGKKCNISKEMKNKMNEATNHHIKNNRHHPEYHDNSNSDNMINRNNRDALPDKLVDATKMTDLDIAEMVADWSAMSEEKGDSSPKAWADKNINKRWKFKDNHKKLIYDLIDKLWNN